MGAESARAIAPIGEPAGPSESAKARERPRTGAEAHEQDQEQDQEQEARRRLHGGPPEAHSSRAAHRRAGGATSGGARSPKLRAMGGRAPARPRARALRELADLGAGALCVLVAWSLALDGLRPDPGPEGRAGAWPLEASAVVVKPHLPKRELEKHIVDEILGEGYDRRIRPSGINNKTGKNDDGPAVVRVNTLIRSISKIDDVTMEYSTQVTLRQEWMDERLAFNRMANKDWRSYNINSITLTEQERLWKPDLFFRNEKEGHFHKIIMPNVLLRINGDGSVLYSIRISLVLACPMDLKYYPLDKQNCTLQMASYGYTDDDLKFIWKEDNPVQINRPLTLPRFTLETFGTAYCTSRTTTGAYSCLRVDLVFKREFSYYLIQIYIPCCMLVIVSWVSFWLDPNAIPARVSLGVTTLLTMATQISGINASLPPVSYTKAIDVWTGVCLTFVFGALLEFALVNYASRSDAHARVQQARQEEELRLRELEFQRRQYAAATAAANAAAAATQATAAGGRPASGLQAQQVQAQAQQQQQQQHQQHQHQLALAGYPGAQVNPPQYAQYNGEKAPAPRQPNGLPFKACSTPLPGANGKQACEVHHSVLHNMPNGAPPAAGSAGKPTSAPASGGPGGNAADAHARARLQSRKRKVNFCRAWLNKFPSRSKRIDVISRIFFPLMFALFNLVYWTTYLFREDDIVQN